VFNVEPSVVPLQSLGVVDAGATDVADNSVLAHAFAKISKSEVGQGYAVKRSSDFVNEYP